MIQTKMKSIIGSGNRKVIAFLICVHVIFLGLYFMHSSDAFTTLYVIGDASHYDVSNKNSNGDDVISSSVTSWRNKRRRYPGRKHAGSSFRNKKYNIEGEMSRKERIMTTDSNFVQHSESLDKISKKREKYRDDVTNSSFIYSPAFPRDQKPAALSTWRRAPDYFLYFQPVDQEEMSWVFSAFYEPAETAEPTAGPASPAAAAGESAAGHDPTRPSVRVLLMVQRRLRRGFYCRLYSAAGEILGTVRGTRMSMKDGHGTIFASNYIECPIPDNVKAAPHSVSLTFSPDRGNLTNKLPIQRPGSMLRNFTVCFSPLHTSYNFTRQLIEAIEFNRLLGAEHFVVYNFSISSETDAILRQYQSDGLVSIVQWRLPNLELWYYGQALAINDCMYRNRGTSKYVVVTDTDELIIPHKQLDWDSLIQDLIDNPSLLEYGEANIEPYPDRPLYNIKPENFQGAKLGAWSFRCSFYVDKRLEFQELKTVKSYNFTLPQRRFLSDFPSIPIISLKRYRMVYKHGKRSKTIVRPECVDVIGVHIVTRIKDRCRIGHASAEVALLHHYRAYRVGKSNILDTSVLRFKDEYLKRLMHAVVKFPTVFPFAAL